MPSKTTVFRWLQSEHYQAFRDQYARAREWQSESHMDDALDSALAESIDPDTKQPAAPFVQRARLLFDVRMSVAERLSPKKYGKLVGKIEDEDGQMVQPVQVVLKVTDASKPDRGGS